MHEVIALLVTGTMLISLSIYGLTRRGTEHPEEPEIIGCQAPAPDDSMLCTEEVGHFGWHRNGETAWFGDTWDCDHWANTQEMPISGAHATYTASEEPLYTESEPTMAAREMDYPNIIGPRPLRFKKGLFGTRRPIPEPEPFRYFPPRFVTDASGTTTVNA